MLFFNDRKFIINKDTTTNDIDKQKTNYYKRFFPSFIILLPVK